MDEITDVNYWLDNFTVAYTTIKNAVLNNLPQVLGAFLILVLGFLIAKLSRLILNKLFRPADKFILLMERKSGRKLFLHKWTVSTLLSSFVYWILILYFFFVAIQVLHFTKLENWIKDLFLYLPGIVTCMVIIVVGFILGAFAYDYVLTASKNRDLENPILIGQSVRLSIIVIFFILGLDQIGLNVSVLVNILTVALGMALLGTAIGFGMGASTHVANLIASRDLRKYLNIGEHIRVGSSEGILIDITSTSIILDSQEGKVKIPSKQANQSFIVVK